MVIKESNYKFICGCCGYSWSSDTDRDKQCPDCSSFDIIIQYENINTALYNEILSNCDSNQLFLYECKCGYTKSLYGANLANIACSDCGQLMKHTADDITDNLKRCRKLHRQSQEEFAKRLGLSQQQYSKMERGLTPVPQDIINKINKKLKE